MSKATSLTEANHKLELASQRDKRHREVMRSLAGNLVQKGAVVLTAGTYGMLRKKQVTMHVKGFPVKVAVWTLATLTEAFTSGLLQRAAGGIGNETLGSFVENSVADGSVSGAEV